MRFRTVFTHEDEVREIPPVHQTRLSNGEDFRENKASGNYFRVSFYKSLLRCGLNFADLGAAKTEAEAKAAQLSRGDLDALQITGKDRLIYGRALEAIRPLNMPFDAAAIEFAKARKILDGLSLLEAVRYFLRHHGRGVRPKPVA